MGRCKKAGPSTSMLNDGTFQLIENHMVEKEEREKDDFKESVYQPEGDPISIF